MTETQALFRILVRYMVKNGIENIEVKLSDFDADILASKSIIIDYDSNLDYGRVQLVSKQDTFKYQKDIN